MATVILKCASCTSEFEKSSHEVSRRRHKTNSLNWFCSRSCAASFGNKRREFKIGPNPQPGNQHRKKYDASYAWYIGRMSGDGRTRWRLKESRTAIYQELQDIWTGVCAITRHPIVRRDRTGKVDTTNPFEIASVDRIDNSLPYQVGNIQWVSEAINKARGKIPLLEFQEYWDALL